MNVVYVDSVFFINALADYFLCLVSARACGVSLRRGRYLAAAAVGGAYAVITYLPGAGFAASLPVMLCAGVLMGLICFGGEEKLLRCELVFLAVSSAFGGAVWAISMASGEAAVSGRVLFLAFALAYALLSAAARCTAKLPKLLRCEVTVELHGKTVRFTALVDTGKHLTDPADGAEVIVASPHALASVLPPGLPDCTEAVSFFTAAAKTRELRGRLRLIAYTAVGGNGMLPAFRPDALTVNGEKRERTLIALSPYVSGEGYEAIV